MKNFAEQFQKDILIIPVENPMDYEQEKIDALNLMADIHIVFVEISTGNLLWFTRMAFGKFQSTFDMEEYTEKLNEKIYGKNPFNRYQ